MPEKKPFNEDEYTVDGEFLVVTGGGHLFYRGIKYIQRNGYYKRASNFSKGKPCTLHRAVWTSHFGEIPPRHHIHHLNGDRADNRIENLQCLPAFTHLSRAAKKSKWVKSKENREHLKVIGRKAHAGSKIHAWHKSPEGRAWFSQDVTDIWKKRKKVLTKCVECGKEYEVFFPSNAKYCSRHCEYIDRKKSGVTNESRKCLTCSKYFVICKYSRTKTCSKECVAAMKRENKKKKLLLC